MKNFSIKEVKQLADELRSDVIFNVSRTGGHLGSSLGVVELTVALHYVFNAPLDRILWDVGHQELSSDSSQHVRSALASVTMGMAPVLGKVTLVCLAMKNEGLIVPGYTHLQRAQPVLLQHLLLAYVEQVEKKLQMRIEAQGKYLQAILEKAQKSLSSDGNSLGSLEATRAQRTDFNLALSGLMENMTQAGEARHGDLQKGNKNSNQQE